MPAPQHDRAKNQFTEGMPTPAEAVRHIREADADADAAVGGDDFEEDVEDGVIDWVALELGGFGDGDEEHGEDDPPDVVGELAAELLADEVGAGFVPAGGESVVVAAGVGVGRQDAPDVAEGVAALKAFCSIALDVSYWSFYLRRRVIGVNSQGPFFVNIGVTDGDHDGIDGNIHHNHVKDEKANAEVGDGNNVKAA